ncbi:MAG: AMP-binding protein [Rhodococcus sp. (in: high G+C Gram-positive bacteria)]|uniref:AMP-binding protein n=1 Tax=Rhodococcus sp. TaxID=1831 RepID=UPI002ADC9472|nr:AMP-binding protein [Rhodococcus sp. (in: high G+C Gram-positive bacteria)]
MILGHPANAGGSVNINPALAVSGNSSNFGGRAAVRYCGGDLTHHELEDRSARLAAVLIDRGVGEGDRVAYLGLNSPALLITMLASFRIGALFVPINFRLAGSELEGVFENSGAGTLVCEAGHRMSVDAVRERTTLKTLLLIDNDPAVAPDAPVPGWLRWSRALAEASPSAGVYHARFDDPAILMYTSGTTGFPKGVVLTYGNLWWNSVNVDSRIDTRRQDVTYATAPLFHIGALNSFVLRTLVRGGTVVLRRKFDAEQFRDDLVDYQINSVFAVPSMLAALSRVPDIFSVDLPALHTIVVAAAPVAPSLIHLFADHGIYLQQAWGLTETAPFATHLPVEQTRLKAGSAGLAMPHTQVRVVDRVTNEPVAAGVPGEVVVRGPNVTPGYWRNPKATVEAFDDEGWFHSGDIGYLDADGYLYIVDRLKDLIISGGENVYPAEVERILAGMPGVADVAVVGVPDATWGETVAAVVSVASGAQLTLHEVREYASANLARYKLPTQLHFVDSVPRNPSGKILKADIRNSLKI